MKLSEIKLNPDNPRTISKEKLEKLKGSIEGFQQMMALRPIIIDDNNVILGGNMRYKALLELGYKEVPDGWIKRASDLTEEQKREFIIKDNVGFGDWDMEMLADWDVELEDWGVDLPTLSSEEPYTTKVESPIYEPTGECPVVSDLYDTEKYDALIEEIESSKVSEAEKKFLRLAATRFIEINYRNVAEYYSHQNGEIKELIENSALVIVDYDKSIERGFTEIYGTVKELSYE